MQQPNPSPHRSHYVGRTPRPIGRKEHRRWWGIYWQIIRFAPPEIAVMGGVAHFSILALARLCSHEPALAALDGTVAALGFYALGHFGQVRRIGMVAFCLVALALRFDLFFRSLFSAQDGLALVPDLQEQVVALVVSPLFPILALSWALCRVWCDVARRRGSERGRVLYMAAHKEALQIQAE